MPVAGRLCERVGSRRVTLAALLLGGSARCFAASLATGLAGLAAALFALRRRLRRDQRRRRTPRASRSSRPLRPPDPLVVPRRVLGRRPRRRRASARSRPRPASASSALRTSAASSLAARARRASATCSRRRPTTRSRSGPGAVRSPGRRGRILVLGAAAFCTMLAEGAAVDWSAVYLSRSFGAAAGVAALALHGLRARDDDEPHGRRPPEPPARPGRARPRGRAASRRSASGSRS